MPRYIGTVTTSGSSEAIRFEKELFRRHPEFRQRAKVRADYIGPGKFLVSVVEKPKKQKPEEWVDPVISACLAFLERDMLEHPEHVRPIPRHEIARMKRLTRGVKVSDDDVIPDDITLE